MPKKTTVIEGLEQVLAETYTLYLQTQNFHWNITGEHFFSLHAAFEEHYTEMAGAIDEIAEQIRQLGALSPGSFAQFEKLASFQHQSGSSDRKMLEILIKQQLAVLKTIRTVRDAAFDAGDEATADLLIGRERAHSKQLWMLQSAAA